MNILAKSLFWSKIPISKCLTLFPKDRDLSSQAFNFPSKLMNFFPKRSTSPVERSMIVLINVLKEFEPFVRPYVLFKDIETQGPIFVSFHTPEP